MIMKVFNAHRPNEPATENEIGLLSVYRDGELESSHLVSYGPEKYVSEISLNIVERGFMRGYDNGLMNYVTTHSVGAMSGERLKKLKGSLEGHYIIKCRDGSINVYELLRDGQGATWRRLVTMSYDEDVRTFDVEGHGVCCPEGCADVPETACREKRS